jgi:protein gp37
MGDRSGIEWTDATWNPVTGCTKVSPGCDHCYAEVFAERWRGVPGHHYEQGFDLKLWPKRLDQPSRWKTPRRIFVNSMSDLFHHAVPDDFVASVVNAMAAAPQHVFQMLTKRPGRMASLLRRIQAEPLPHVRWGTSIEDNDYAWRADKLRQAPAAVRFLSCEPLIGPVPSLNFRGLDWVIIGGESGPQARGMDWAWVRDIRDRAWAAGAAVFVKQSGSVVSATTGTRNKGTDPRRWPKDLRVREYPSTALTE